MKFKNLLFILLNTILFMFLWSITTSGMIDSNYSVLRWLVIISIFLELILELGGEFIIFSVYSYKSDFKFNYKVIVFIVIVNIIILKLSDSNFSNLIILLMCINQIFGILCGNFIKFMKRKKVN